MNRITTLALALTLTTFSAFAADNSLGTWKRNIQKSTYNPQPPNPYKSQTTTRESSAGGVRVTSKGERMDGMQVNGSYTVKYDGTPASVSGSGNFDTISIKQIDENTFTSELSKSGTKYRTSGKTVISKDGKTMTVTQKGTGADGKPISYTIVSDKQ